VSGDERSDRITRGPPNQANQALAGRRARRFDGATVGVP